MGWRFYVYELIDAAGRVLYVGKGSGYRLTSQKRTHALDGREVARFKRESDAYAFEVRHIAALRPERNKLKGGNGSRATPRRCVEPKPYPRENIARWLLVNANAIKRFDPRIELDIAALQRVAYG